MNNTVKLTPQNVEHKVKVATLKACLPVGWLNILKERTKRGSTFISIMINSHENWRDEWAEVEKLRNETIGENFKPLK